MKPKEKKIQKKIQKIDEKKTENPTLPPINNDDLDFLDERK